MNTDATTDQQFATFLDQARRDPNILGVILVGSRGKGAYVTSVSDFDAVVVVGDASLIDAYAQRYPSRHGDPIEYILVSLDAFRSYAKPGESSRWDAYTFAHIEPLIDKLDGEIARLVREKPLVAPGSAAEFLDGYINAYHRSAKNHAAGRETEGHLDAAESVPWFLDFVFATAGRVRPFNKWLLWELERHPLDSFWGDDLVPSLMRIVASGDLVGQQTLFRCVEEFARSHQLGDVIDSWEPDVALLRGPEDTAGA